MNITPKPISPTPSPAVAETNPSYFEIKKTTEKVIILKYLGKDPNVVIPASIEGLPVAGVGENAFCDCNILVSVRIPETVTEIGNWAFSGCTSLTSISLPKDVSDIGDHAFYNCTALNFIILPLSVTTISDWVFRSCDNLKAIFCEAESLSFDWSYNWATNWNGRFVAPFYWQSEKPNTDGSHWHYVDGAPEIWKQ